MAVCAAVADAFHAALESPGITGRTGAGQQTVCGTSWREPGPATATTGHGAGADAPPSQAPVLARWAQRAPPERHRCLPATGGWPDY